MIIKPYTSGTMQANWRGTLMENYHDLAREVIQKRWEPQHIPADYTRPRQEIDHLLTSVVWLHPRAPIATGDGDSADAVGFYIPRNLRLINDCDFLLSCIFPGFPSIDSAHEVGVAYARGKPVITVDLTHGSRDYAAWRAMSLVTLDSLERAARFLLYQVQEAEPQTETDLIIAAIQAQGDKL
jgi:hypothetical protein